MGKDVSIVYKGIDQLTGVTTSVRTANRGLNKDMEATSRLAQDYVKRQEAIAKQLAKTQTALAGAGNGLKDAKKAYAALNDETSKGKLEEAYKEYNKLTSELGQLKTAAKDTSRALGELDGQQRKSQNASGAGSGASMLGQLGKAGMLKMAGDTLSGVANVGIGSAFGSEVGTMFSSVLSGAAAGAALGSVVPVIGTAVGAAVGGILGAVNGGAQIFQQRDDAFKGYVQENTEGQLSQRGAEIQEGSAVAGQRQMDTIAFNRLLGQGTGDKYLTDLRTMAAKTPMEYSDLTTMSRSLATGFKDDPSRMLGLMSSIGNAGSAIGVDAGGMNMMATAMSRMQASGKVSLEYLNLIQERGVDAVGMLAQGLGKSKADIYDMISKGKIDGVAAVQIIQDKMDEMYSGAMEMQSKTFAGLSSTLADANTEMKNAYGEGYNEVRGKGLKDQIDYLSGESGTAMQDANRAIGAWQASLENSKEAFVRTAQDAVLNSADYKAAMEAGTDEGYAEAGRMLMAAKVKGQNEYNASEGAQLALESELSLAASIRGDTTSNAAYYDAGYRKSQEYGKGLAAGIRANPPALSGDYDSLMGYGMSSFLPTANPTNNNTCGNPAGYAYGLSRVPRDNFPALLHEGERVLTANQARQQDTGGGGGGGVVVYMNGVAIREEADIGKIAKAFAAEMVRARALSTG